MIAVYALLKIYKETKMNSWKSKYMTTAELTARDDVARQIRELKKEKDMPTLNLGIDAQLSSPTLCEIYREDGTACPSFRSMIRIFDALGLKEVTIRWK